MATINFSSFISTKVNFTFYLQIKLNILKKPLYNTFYLEYTLSTLYTSKEKIF